MHDQATQAEKVLSAARRKYLAGSADFLVVTDAQRALYTARDQLSDIRRARAGGLGGAVQGAGRRLQYRGSGLAHSRFPPSRWLNKRVWRSFS